MNGFRLQVIMQYMAVIVSGTINFFSKFVEI